MPAWDAEHWRIMNFIFKAWRLVGKMILIFTACLLVLIGLAVLGRYSDEREYARAAVWANDMTVSVLYGEHQWDLVRIVAMSKDGHYFIVSGSVGSEDSLKELHSKLENPPSYIGTAPIYINWNVQIETNRFSAKSFLIRTPSS